MQFSIGLEKLRQIRNPTMLLIDTHAHVFEAGLPLDVSRRYTPAKGAPLSEYLRLLDTYGVAAGVLVQPSFLGADNSFLLAALAAAPERLRGIAVITPDAIGQADLTRMKAAGVVGIRLNLIGGAAQAQMAGWTRARLREIAALDWQIEVQADGPDLPEIVDRLSSFDGPLVIDHFGRPDARRGVKDPGFQRVLEAGPGGNVWIKLSAPYRLNGADPHRYAEALLDRLGPGRLLWGSDWPWTQYESGRRYEDCLAAFQAWCPALEVRAEMGRTAQELFGFPNSLGRVHALGTPVSSPRR